MSASQENTFVPSSESPRSCRTKCSICKNTYTDPRILPCLHTFCLDCVRGLQQFSIPRTQREGESGSLDCTESRICILCPACDYEVNVPAAGLRELTGNHLIQNEVFLESLKRPDYRIVCDLCNDGNAERRCHVCSTNLCDFCSEAHRRQKMTASHNTVALTDLQGRNERVNKSIMCFVHPAEELRLFCETCDCLVCRDCCMVDHRDHNCDFVANVINKYGSFIRQLLKQTQPHIAGLQETLQKIADTRQLVQKRLRTLTGEINKFTEDYIKALEKHRSSLLKELEELRIQKENSLNLQQIQLQQILADMKTGVDFTEHLLTNGSPVEILLTKRVVVNRLKLLNKTSYSTQPREDDGIQFQQQERAGQCNGFEVFGIIVTKTLDPSKCLLQGEGLRVAWQDQPSVFVLVCNDQSGQQIGRGGESIQVSIYNKKNKECTLKTILHDNHDGTYQFTYTPRVSGLYEGYVCMKGQHVQGSPFSITVTSKYRKHTGIFHCCTFCSSVGQKDVRCGCGGTMLGGYQGCGHGHKGHPGQPHWSCCGKLTEHSECSGTINSNSYQNLVRTVAL
ncbi:E3 ubiquitin-protein ligase TRIM45 isoform X1 [Stegostoma tigrinum]|uniref:E3 ubiquitin-protein ligase TRIM45 isoform X1 n=1 Tax=Stegostoma tigrinum TaxID=3053191 RepID=UPI0028707845|nr:E3 ubiquitin-protein ligase TRIM45 isoform X1 [Stegostoma tigrinum]